MHFIASKWFEANSCRWQRQRTALPHENKKSGPMQNVCEEWINGLMESMVLAGCG